MYVVHTYEADKIREIANRNWDHKACCFNRLMEKLEQLGQNELMEDLKTFNQAWHELALSWQELERARIGYHVYR